MIVDCLEETCMNEKKPSLGVKETKTEQPVSNGGTRPKNPSANILPTEGYVLEIDGKFKTEYVRVVKKMKRPKEPVTYRASQAHRSA
jgi:hypothetical protein